MADRGGHPGTRRRIAAPFEIEAFSTAETDSGIPDSAPFPARGALVMRARATAMPRRFRCPAVGPIARRIDASELSEVSDQIGQLDGQPNLQAVDQHLHMLRLI
jgi:hypothetical protein